MGALPPEGEIGRAVSNVLTEVRTVLSRAESALRTIRRNPGWYLEMRESHWDKQSGQLVVDSPALVTEHPGIKEIIPALEDVIERLSPFEKTGKTKYDGNGY